MRIKNFKKELNISRGRRLYFFFMDLYNQSVIVIKDENIGNHGYIGTSILRIYRIYRRYIGGYSGKKY